MTWRPRRVCRSLLIGIVASAGLAFAPASTVALAATTTTSVDQTDESPDATTNDFLDLERSLTECISSNPPPGCGREPTSPGDRGGWQQLVLFGVMMGGIAVIFWRVSRSVRSRDASMSTERSTEKSTEQSAEQSTEISAD